jgi:hypothetical protein
LRDLAFAHSYQKNKKYAQSFTDNVALLCIVVLLFATFYTNAGI